MTDASFHCVPFNAQSCSSSGRLRPSPPRSRGPKIEGQGRAPASASQIPPPPSLFRWMTRRPSTDWSTGTRCFVEQLPAIVVGGGVDVRIRRVEERDVGFVPVPILVVLPALALKHLLLGKNRSSPLGLSACEIARAQQEAQQGADQAFFSARSHADSSAT